MRSNEQTITEDGVLKTLKARVHLLKERSSQVLLQNTAKP
jgi:hypothetical protein